MEEGVEFHSTPFVFVTDTFTGKFLCGFYLGWGHYLKYFYLRYRLNPVPILFLLGAFPTHSEKE